MSDRVINGYCGSHCKEPVYSQEQVNKLLQEMEAGKTTLLWYKGTNSKYVYEYGGYGVDPSNIKLETYSDLLSAILSGGVDLTENDMDILSDYTPTFVKVYYDGAEYCAIYNGELYIMKNNYYINKIDGYGVFQTINIEASIRNLNMNDEVQDARLEVLESHAIVKNVIYENTAGVEIGNIDTSTSVQVATLEEDLEAGTELEIHVTITETGDTKNITYPLVIKGTLANKDLVLSLAIFIGMFAGHGVTPIYQSLTTQTTNAELYCYEIFPRLNLTENDGQYDLTFNKTCVLKKSISNGTLEEETSKSILLNKVIKITNGEKINEDMIDSLLDQLNGEVV